MIDPEDHETMEDPIRDADIENDIERLEAKSREELVDILGEKDAAEYIRDLFNVKQEESS